jgi:hypothetical protein
MTSLEQEQMSKIELKAAAEAYWEQGLAVVPFVIGSDGKKKPPVNEWGQWQTRPQTREEFDALHIERYKMFGVACGTKTVDGVYFCIVDRDIKAPELTEEIKAKTLKAIKLMRTTKTEKTRSGGQHLLYYSRTQFKGQKLNDIGMELLGLGQLCVMAPSEGYSQELSSDLIATVDNLENDFLNAIAQAGLKEKPARPQTATQPPKQYERIPLRPCCERLIEKQHLHHNEKVALVCELYYCGWTEQEIRRLFYDKKAWEPEPEHHYSKTKTEEQITYTIGKGKEGNYRFTKKALEKWRVCYPECALIESSDCRKKPAHKKDKDSDEPSILYVPRPTVKTNEFLAEMIWNRIDPPEYLVYNFQNDSFTKTAELDLGETDAKGRTVIYVPPFNDSLKKGLVIVPSGYTETTFKEVCEEIDRFATSAYDPCGQDALVKLLARIAVGSWFLDRFVADPLFDIAGAGKFAPILPIRGPSQSGKNRLAFVLRLVSYRPLFEMSTYRIPSLYRPLDLWQGTLVLDEADFANTTEKSELIHFLNCRATGTPLSRQNPRNPRCTDTFSNFGLTIVTQRRPFDDNATESRAVPYYSETSDKKLPVIETDEMLRQGLDLQNKLLYLRMKYYRQVVIDKEAWLNDLCDHRLVASLLPLLALSKYEPSLKETITDTAKEVEKAKIEEKANSMDGQIVNFLWEKIDEGLFENWRPNVFYVLESRKIEENNGSEEEHKTALTTRHIADAFKWSPTSIRKTLSSLGICEKGLSNQVRVDGHNTRVIFFDPRRLEKRLREFVVNYTINAVADVTGVAASTRDTQKSPLLSYSENSDTLHRKTATTVTSVTEPSEYPRYPEHREGF